MSDERIVSLDIAEIGRELEGFRLKDPRRTSEIEASIRLTGTLPPILVAKIGNLFVLVDGFKRLEAARRAGLTRVPTSIIDADRARALGLLGQVNGRGESLSALEEGWIVHELHRVHGQTFEQIAAGFGRDKSWAARREQLVLGLSPEVQSLLREGGLDPTAAQELVLLRHHNQEILARRAAEARLSVAQLRVLVRLILSAPDPAHSQYLVDHPREVLQLTGFRQAASHSDPWSELERRLELAPCQAVGPDPACRERLIGLCRNLLDFLEAKNETGNDLARSGASCSESSDPRDLAATQNLS